MTSAQDVVEDQERMKLSMHDGGILGKNFFT